MPRRQTHDRNTRGPWEPILRHGFRVGGASVGNTPNMSVHIEDPATVLLPLGVLTPTLTFPVEIAPGTLLMPFEVLEQTTPSPGFDPNDIAGLTWWLDAADTATITESGGVVTDWTDKSASARTTQIGGSPTTGLSTVNGHNVIDLSNTDYFGTAAFLYASDFTLFVVGQSSDDVVWHQAIGGAWGAFTHPRIRVYSYSSTNTQIRYYSSGGGTVFNINNTPGWGAGLSLWAIRVQNGVSPELRVYENGSLRLTISSFTPVAFAWEVLWASANGYACEALAYNSHLDDADFAAVDTYLTDKWGV